MDEWVGKRLQELEDDGLADSTFVFFFSDHGVGLPRGKRSPYDLGTRVPLLVRFPVGAEERRAGTVEERVVSFVDFGPTVLSLARVAPDERLDGVAFLGSHARVGGGFAFAHADRFDGVYDRARSVSDGRFRYVRNLDTDIPHLVPNAYRENLEMMADLLVLQENGPERQEQWQVSSRNRSAEELYNSRLDPWEVQNLVKAPEHAEVLARLRGALDEWIEDTGDLGLVLPELRMVEEHLWPAGVQPSTAAPTLQVEDGRVTLACDTEGASIGYRLSDGGPWTVYSGPFEVEGIHPLEVVAHRIGFKPAQERFERP